MKLYSTTPQAQAAIPAHLFPTQTLAEPVYKTAYFVALDHEFIEKWLPLVSGNAWKVLCALARWKGANAEAHPKKRTLAVQTGFSVQTVERMLDELKALGLIESRPFFDAQRDGRQCANRYFFRVELHKLNPRPLPKLNPQGSIKSKVATKKNQEKENSIEQQHAARDFVADSPSEPTPSPERDALQARLADEANFSTAAAAALLKTFPMEKITLQLNWLPARKPRDKAACLRHALNIDRPAPHRETVELERANAGMYRQHVAPRSALHTRLEDTAKRAVVGAGIEEVVQNQSGNPAAEEHFDESLYDEYEAAPDATHAATTLEPSEEERTEAAREVFEALPDSERAVLTQRIESAMPSFLRSPAQRPSRGYKLSFDKELRLIWPSFAKNTPPTSQL